MDGRRDKSTPCWAVLVGTELLNHASMRDNPSLRPRGEQGRGSKIVTPNGRREFTNSEVKGRKKRRWFNPKDKSVARKTFLKLRDAKARSRFSKLQKKATEAAANSADFPLPIISADDNNSFLERLMDPFASVKPEERTPLSERTEGKELMLEGSKSAVSRGHDQLRTIDCSSEALRGTGSLRARETESPACGEDDGHSEATVKELETRGLASVKEGKGYMPFIRAKRAFEAKQREREALRLAQQLDAQKEKRRRKEKKRLDKVTHKKLQARTTRGQPVMGNLVDVLLLKMQKKRQ